MAARSTMATLVATVRTMTNAGTDVTDVSSYVSDDDIQTALDLHRRDVWYERMTPIPRVMGSGGSVNYFDYQAGYQNLEATDAGTALFIIRDGLGNISGTATYSVNYQRGLVSFTANTAGSARYLDARTYDLYAAAADVLDNWAAREMLSYDVTTEDQSFKRNQKVTELRNQASLYRRQAWPVTIGVIRSDTCW